MQGNLTGIYGKLPAHGDFIYRDLPSTFINVWDEWLQGFMGNTREHMGDDWLDVYLTSPIWRFTLAEGVVDQFGWAGIVLPSVDRVGRYFPFTVATRLPANTNPTEFMCSRPNWYLTMEDAAMRALDGQLVIDELVEELNDSYPMSRNAYTLGRPIDSPARMIVKMENEEQPVSSVLPMMLHACIAKTMPTYSIWSTKGSNYIAPCAFVAQGLPPLSGISAMMDGHWEHWGWQEPFPFKDGQ